MALLPLLRRAAPAFAFALALALARAEEAGLLGEAAVAADDECAGAGPEAAGECALNALQHKAAGRKVAAASAPEPADAKAVLNSSMIEVSDVAADGSDAQGCQVIPYSGDPTGAESCFCHKAGNPTCVSKPCTCREGCGGYMMHGWAATTFDNKSPTSCRGAKLTVPKSYFTDIADAKNKCGGGTQSLLSSMLTQGFMAYAGVSPGPVFQCIHKPWSVSVHWLHLHTFCKDGHVEDMPNRGSAFCFVQTSIGESGRIAAEMLALV